MPRIFDALGRRLDSVLLSPRAREVRRRRLTYLTPRKLRALETTLRQVRRAGVSGDFLEFGVALGGSAVVIAAYADDGHAFHGYDVFGMIPPPGPEDGERAHRRYAEIRTGRSGGVGGDVYYGYVDHLYERVHRTFSDFGLPVDGRRVALHRGRFEETLHAAERRPVAFAHIDCDWYAPVSYCLAAIRPRLAPGACVVLDDYNDYGGCRRAVDAFLAEHRDLRVLCHAPSAIIERPTIA
jgi:asparagine synthase (glutamine-hydrolysing)